MLNQKMHHQIDEFIAKSHALTGEILREREPWNTVVTPQAIRHFAVGISDDNPLWLSPEYASKSSYGRLLAPPTFLTSVLYPILHGAPMSLPMSNLIGELEFHWLCPIFSGDTLTPEAKQTGVYESLDRQARRLVCISSQTRYWNQTEALVGKANATLIWREQSAEELIAERAIYHYTEEELAQIEAALQAETRTGNRPLFGDDIDIGQELPVLVRGPFTIGDLVCWQAAIGPSYRPGSLGYKDGLRSSHTLVKNPATGWSVKSSQQHEDFLLAKQRGMSAPFDNGVMRFAWLSPLLTNWMGDEGKLQRLSVRLVAPILYGDTTWYRGVVTRKDKHEDGIAITIKITGTNQLGETTTEGEAEVLLPSRQKRKDHDPTTVINVTYPNVPTVSEMIEERVKEMPDAIALIGNNRCLTYQETNHRANQLARYLRAQGVKPNDVVGICLERSPDFIIAVWGVLKAGGAYLPLDATYPSDRLAFMLQDSQVEHLLTRKTLWPNATREPVNMFDLTELEETLAMIATQNLAPIATANDLAYVIYTSGSTGQPKAVAPTHFNLSSYISAIGQSLSIEAQDRYLHTASFSFSAAVRQIFFPLAMGATLVIANSEQRQEPRVLFEWMQAQNVTIWDTVPTFWRFCIDWLDVLDASERQRLLDNSLRLILVTGEPLNWDLPYRWRYQFQQKTGLVNLYSQSETTGTVTYYSIPQDFKTKTGIVPLGRALDDVQILLLDEHGQLVPKAQVGEICVASKRLPQGYLARPQLTAKKFVPNPFDEETSPVLYKTGDLARYTDLGILEFVGRADRRIKIRGFRVELEEIETVLRQHIRVRETVVIARLTSTGDRQIVAYIVPHLREELTAKEIRAFVGQKLPDYMVPATFVFLETVPRTASGKLDRRSLPIPNLSRLGLHNAFVEPKDELELELAKIWENMFDIRPIGTSDNFFELGGHSLNAMGLFTKIEQIFGRNLPPSLLFQAPTIEQLAHLLRQDGWSASWSSLVPIQPNGSLPPLFCVHGIGGNILSYGKLAEYLPDDQPLYGLQAQGLNGHHPYITTIEEMASHYVKEIQSVQPEGPYFLAAHSFGGKVIFEMAQQLHRQGERVALLALIDSSSPKHNLAQQSAEEERQQKEAFMNELPDWSQEPKVRPLVEVLYEAKRTYQAQPYPGKVIYFAARNYGNRNTEQFIEHWRELVADGLECYEVDGDHWSMLDEPHVQGLCEKLEQCFRGFRIR